MADLAVLKSVLESDPRYDTVVRTGRNSECLQLLNATKTGAAKVWNDIPVEDFLEALGSFVLPAVAETRLQTIIASNGEVPTSRAGVRSWLQANITDTNIITALRALAEREETWAEAAGIGQPSLNDVREVVRQIAKSFIVSTGQV